MGCCENKSIQTDFVMFPEKHIEIRQPSFDDISIYSEEENIRKCTEASPLPPPSFNNTFNSVELAFLMGSTLSKSKTQSLLIPEDED